MSVQRPTPLSPPFLPEPAARASGAPLHPDADDAPLPRLGPYRLVRVAGSGGMGVVYEAVHEGRGERVALKTLPRLDPNRLLRLKQEFRALARVSHPHLVAFHELVGAGDRWYLAMAFVEGRTLMEALGGWRREPGGEVRLRDALRQLAEGVHALHERGLLHLDLKPANAMVDERGHVVVLDFGLAHRVEEAREGPLWGGTPAYMAPERTLRMPVGPPADWYAFGAVLHELLVGTPPFAGGADRWLGRFMDVEPDLGPDAADLPADLVQLCVGLLRFDPEARLSGPAVVGRLGGRIPRRAPSAPFLGREPEMERLREAWRDVAAGRSRCVWVRGPSGIGKSAIVARFLAEVEGDSLVLRGRCHEREHVAYGGFDAVVDEVARVLACMPPETWPARWDPPLLAAVRLFPTLGPLVPADAPLDAGMGGLSPTSLRTLAFHGLERLLHTARAGRPLVVFLDDVHWSDADGARLWARLVAREAAGPLLLVGALRDEEARTSAFVAELDALRSPADRRDDVVVPVGPLRPETAERFADALMGPLACARRDEVLREAGGNPFLLEILARHALVADGGGGAVTLATAVREQVGTLPAAAADLLRLAAIFGQPAPLDVLLRAAGNVEEPVSALLLLEGRSLVRLGGLGAQDRVEPYHARIGEAVVGGLGGGERAALHARLAAALEGAAATEPHVLAHHLYGSGDLAGAAVYAERAAARADAALAFARAAGFYERALEWGPPDPVRAARLLEAMGHARANAGQVVGAATAWRRAASLARGDERDRLERLAADALMLGGRVDEGVALLEPHLRRAGIPHHRGAAAVMSSVVLQLFHVALTGTTLRERGPTEAALARADLCWSLGKGLAYVVPLEGVDAVLRSLRMAVAAGDRARAARALAFLAAGVFHQIGPLRATSERYLAQARALAETLGDRGLLATIGAWEGMTALAPGRWAEGAARLEAALAELEAVGVGLHWERTVAAGMLALARQTRGELSRSRALAAAGLQEAADRGDLYGQVLFSQFVAWADVPRGDTDGARAKARWIVREWAKGRFTVPSFYAMAIEVMCDLYEGRPSEARARWTATQKPFRRAGGDQAPVSRIDNAQLEARLLLHGPETATSRRRLWSLAGRLRGEARRDGPALAAWLEAALVSPGEKVAALRDAARFLEEAELGMHAACLRLQAARLVEERGAEVEARGWLAAQGVVDPVRWAGVFAPGGFGGAAGPEESRIA